VSRVKSEAYGGSEAIQQHLAALFPHADNQQEQQEAGGEVADSPTPQANSEAVAYNED